MGSSENSGLVSPQLECMIIIHHHSPYVLLAIWQHPRFFQTHPTLTWRFPKIGLPPNYPFLDGIFHEVNHPAITMTALLHAPRTGYMRIGGKCRPQQKQVLQTPRRRVGSCVIFQVAGQIGQNTW